MTDKLCTTCVFQETPATTTVCQTCTRGGVPGAPHWKGWHYTGEKQEAAAAVTESLTRLTLGAVMVPAGHDMREGIPVGTTKSDGSTANYYALPPGANELQDLISYRGMNAQVGEIFRACYRYGLASHSDRLRDAKKMKFYSEAEIARLEKYGG